MGGIVWFQSQTRRLLPRNIRCVRDAKRLPEVSIADATLASPQPGGLSVSGALRDVSIADATLASPQPCGNPHGTGSRLVSIADATLASPQLSKNWSENPLTRCFNRRRDTCFPATWCQIICWLCSSRVSIADATLASPQLQADRQHCSLVDRFNRRRDACFPATTSCLRPGRA